MVYFLQRGGKKEAAKEAEKEQPPGREESPESVVSWEPTGNRILLRRLSAAVTNSQAGSDERKTEILPCGFINTEVTDDLNLEQF